MRRTLSLLSLGIFLTSGSAGRSQAQDWQSLVPLHSTRAEVKKLLGEPLFEEGRPIDIYDVIEGRLNIMYVLNPCQQGLPSNWGNWNVPKDTVVNITVHLKNELRISDLKIPDLEKLKWYTDDTQTTYYQDNEKGIEYSVSDGAIRSMSYGPKQTDEKLLCRKNAPKIRY